MAYSKPRTIEELKAFCAEHNMPLEKLRFYIGEDYRGPRAFGIYQDDEGMFVVYKNKSDGTRAVRYRGADEFLAVNEIYEKLRKETELRRSASAPERRSSQRARTPGQSKKSLATGVKIGVAVLAIAAVVGIGAYAISRSPEPGYYSYNGSVYYYTDRWYNYDYGLNEWIIADGVDRALEDNCDGYYVSRDYPGQAGYSDFSETEYYSGWYEDSWYSRSDDDYYSSDDDYDWDWDSGYDSWDSGGTDWDSDW